MNAPLAGRHALVTGAGGGIGRAIALALAGEGANLTLLGRHEGRLDATADAAGGAFTVAADVRHADSVDRAFVAASERFGPVDILVNAAGMATSAPFRRTPADDWHDVIDANLNGVFHCCRNAIGPMLEARWGRIVNVASTAGLRGYRYVTAYCAAKHGVIGLTRALALETADAGITVNAVCPGYTETTMLEETLAAIVARTGRSAESVRATLLRATPRGAFTQSVEVANAVTWLCLPGSEAVTGQAIAVDGGETAG